MASVSSSWNRISSWLQSNAPEALEPLQAAASADQIGELENAIGLSLPADVREFYETVNGNDPNQAWNGIFPSCDDYDQMAFGPLSVEQIQRESEIQRELLESGDFEGCEPEECAPGVRSEPWNTGWIPFAGNGGGDLYCIDLSPADGGTPGQVISHNHESFDHQILAPSFASYLEQLADQLDKGELEFTEDWGMAHVES